MTKRFINYLIIFLVASCLLYTSCTSGKYAKQITKIDSLLIVLDSSFSKLNLLDTSVVESYYKVYVNNIKQIKNSFEKKDNEEVWSVITRYGLLRKPLRDFKKHYTKYSKEISFTQEQLNNLKADIKNDVLSEDKISQYINDESEFVNYINFSVTGLIENTQKYFYQYLELNPKVEMFLSEGKIGNVQKLGDKNTKEPLSDNDEE